MDIRKIAYGFGSGLVAGIIMLSLPFIASAASSDVRDDVNRTNSEMRNQANRTSQDMRNQANRTSQDMRDATLNQQDRDQRTMDRLQRQEDRQTTGEYLDDAGVTAKVKAKILGQQGLDSLDIKVVTVDGNVTLMGDVDNAAQIGLAESVAKEVDGVAKVTNDLVVKK